MNELRITGTLDSREVAAMVGKEHFNLLRDIESYIAHMEEIGELKIEVSEFFQKSSYFSEQNKELPCYLITKQGCEMIANKLTGAKGVQFTALYVSKFNEMEQRPALLSPADLLDLQVRALREIEQKQKVQQAAIESVNNRIDAIGNIIALNPNDWRRESSSMIVKIAQVLGGNEFIREVKAEIYKLMLDRFAINVKQRVTNKRRKAYDEGTPRSRCERISGVDAIADDKKAIEAYLAIIKEMAIKHGLDKPA